MSALYQDFNMLSIYYRQKKPLNKEGLTQGKEF